MMRNMQGYTLYKPGQKYVCKWVAVRHSYDATRLRKSNIKSLRACFILYISYLLFAHISSSQCVASALFLQEALVVAYPPTCKEH